MAITGPGGSGALSPFVSFSISIATVTPKCWDGSVSVTVAPDGAVPTRVPTFTYWPGCAVPAARQTRLWPGTMVRILGQAMASTMSSVRDQVSGTFPVLVMRYVHDTGEPVATNGPGGSSAS